MSLTPERRTKEFLEWWNAELQKRPVICDQDIWDAAYALGAQRVEKTQAPDDARQLERELAAARAAESKMSGHLYDEIGAREKAEADLASLQAENAGLREAVRMWFFAIDRIKLQGGSTHEAGEASDYLRELAGMDPELPSFQASPNATLDELRAALALNEERK
jgi:hypothetical protein